MSITPPIPPYGPSLFVNREEEIGLVVDKVHQFLRGRPPHPPHTAFCGPRGAGKSWLLRHLAEDVLPRTFNGHICILFHPLDPADPDLVRNTLTTACSTLGLSIPAGAQLDDISLWLITCCQGKNHPIVVIVDELDKIPPDTLKELEKYFLLPLAKEKNVLLILGSRVPSPGGRLSAPEIKLRIENRELPEFNEPQTAEQLQRLEVDPSKAPKIRDTSGGYPLANAIMALTGDIIACARALLEGVNPDLREYFWALSVPDRIDVEQMPRFLAAYYNNEPSVWDAQTCWRIVRDMAQTHLVRWQQGTRYTMDPAVRRVLRNALPLEYPDRWERLSGIPGIP